MYEYEYLCTYEFVRRSRTKRVCPWPPIARTMVLGKRRDESACSIKKRWVLASVALCLVSWGGKTVWEAVGLLKSPILGGDVVQQTLSRNASISFSPALPRSVPSRPWLLNNVSNECRHWVSYSMSASSLQEAGTVAGFSSTTRFSFHSVLRLLRQPFPSWCVVISVHGENDLDETEIGRLLSTLVLDYSVQATALTDDGNSAGNFLPADSADDIAKNLMNRIVGVWISKGNLKIATMDSAGWQPQPASRLRPWRECRFIKRMVKMIVSANSAKRKEASLAVLMTVQRTALRNIAYLVAVRHDASVVMDVDHSDVLSFSLDRSGRKKGTRRKSSDYPPFSWNYIDQEPVSSFSPISDHVRILVPLSSEYDASEMEYSPEGVAQGSLFGNFSTLSDLVALIASGVARLAPATISLSNVAVLQAGESGPRLLGDGAVKGNLLVSSGITSLYKASGTVHFRKSFWGLVLPLLGAAKPDFYESNYLLCANPYAIRATRTYASQRVWKALDMALLYTPDVFEGFEASSIPPQCSQYIDDLAGAVRRWKPPKSGKKSSFAADVYVRDLWKHFFKEGITHSSDTEMMSEWIVALSACGYQFPAVREEETSFRVHLHPTLHNQVIEAWPRYNLAGGLFRFRSYNQYMVLTSSSGSQSEWDSYQQVKAKTDIPRPPRTVLKLIVMTKDEWPLIKHSILYHGELVGFEHLHVLDGSSDPRSLEFLRYARDYLGANVIFTSTNLEGLAAEMSYLALRLASSGDYVIKMDTDEFLVVYKGDPTCDTVNGTQRDHVLRPAPLPPHDCSLSPFRVADFLASRQLEQSGSHIIRVSYTSFSEYSTRAECDEGRSDDIGHHRFASVQPTRFKSIYDARTMRLIHLGGHSGRLYSPFKVPPRSDEQTSLLGIIHVHQRCPEHELRNSRKAFSKFFRVVEVGPNAVGASLGVHSRVELIIFFWFAVSHGYIDYAASDNQTIEAVKKIALANGVTDDLCVNLIHHLPIQSSHKFLFVYRALACPGFFESVYSTEDQAAATYANADFAAFLDMVLAKYDVK
jgi:Glycosyl transferase family 2